MLAELLVDLPRAPKQPDPGRVARRDIDAVRPRLSIAKPDRDYRVIAADLIQILGQPTLSGCAQDFQRLFKRQIYTAQRSRHPLARLQSERRLSEAAITNQELAVCSVDTQQLQARVIRLTAG